MSHLVIIGFMGSGKSRLSSLISHRFGVPVFSTDDEIIKSMQMSIAEIFERFGEEFFRLKENEIFDQIASLSGSYVVDCGGGFGIYQEVKALGEVVFLDVEFEVILERMDATERKKRPLMARVSREMFDYRRAIYMEKANLTLQEVREEDFVRFEQLFKLT